MTETVNIQPVNIETEMRQSYMDYAMSVIIGRALPDVRDGLKPVQRRVLYAMIGEGLTSTKKHSKCAGVVGEVLKRLHPHGDSSVYDALVRLAQPWTLRYPLVDGQGNFGSIDGDPAAAYRYTECRMTAIAEKLLEDIDKDTVDFIPNFDDSGTEPVVLPSVLPHLLVNGADGIAVGMATHMPPHNLVEVINGVIAFLNNPEIGLEELMEHIPGPDFPTGALMYGRGPLASAYATGKGIVQMRARTSFETIKSGTREVEAIVVTEIPFQVNKARLIEKIADLVNEKTIDGISRLRDESDRSGMRIVIELKRDATAEVVLNQLFKMTPLQSSFGIINLAIVENKPVICSLTDLITHFVNHRRDVVTRRTQFDLRKAQERMHILEGFRIALLNLDEVIKLIRGAETGEDARTQLQSRYSLSQLQAQAILDLRLQKLTGMERLAVEQQHAELAKEIEYLRSILADTKKVDSLIEGELVALREAFPSPRRTEIVDDGGEIDLVDLIEDEEMVVSISHKGYIKRTALAVYRSQKRGGKGIAGAAQNSDEDFVEQLFSASTLSVLLFFTSHGRAYSMKVYQIPEAGRTAKGRAVINLLSLKEGETLTTVLSVPKFNAGQFIFMATKAGVVKKVDLLEFENVKRNGLIACSLDEGDLLIGVGITGGDQDIILTTRQGMAARFNEADVRAMGRGARGVKGINLGEGNEVVSMTVAAALPVAAESAEGETSTEETEEPAESEGDSAAESQELTVAEDELTLLTVCQNGYGKRTPIRQYRFAKRGAKGVKDICVDDRNGPVIGSIAVTSESNLMLITSSGKVIRTPAKGISVRGRNTKGVRLIDLESGEKVLAVARLVEKEDVVE